MADKKTTEETAITKPATQHLAPAPSYIKTGAGAHYGLEDTTADDMLIPRLALAQPLTPQALDGNPQQIAGLKPGDLFNSVTKEVYGKTVRVQLLRKMPKRAMEFYSQEDGGGVKDPNVPLDDDRLKFHGDKKPAATLFRDFIALLLPQNEIISLSFKSSGIKAAKTLWGMVGFRNADCFAGQYKISTAMKHDPKPHYIYVPDNDGWVTEEQFNYGRQMAEAAAGLSAEHIQHESDADEFEDVPRNADGTDRVGPNM